MTCASSLDRMNERLALQARLDATKTQVERNRLGQFATPDALAQDILDYAKTLLPDNTPIRFLDPAIGTGAFYAALRNTYPASRIQTARGFEIDPHYGTPAATLWRDGVLDMRIADFTCQMPETAFNLLICNPPYVRHHHLNSAQKARLQATSLDAAGIRLSGLSGLYCHFLAQSHAWMSDGGIAGWLIPSEFMDVNYGQAVKRYLLERVTLLHIHRFDPTDVQFADALVSSAVVWFRKSPPPTQHQVKFTFGGTLADPAQCRHVRTFTLEKEPKWTRFPVAAERTRPAGGVVSDFFTIKRGIATGDNDFFILDEDTLAQRNLPREVFRPILPSPRHIKANEIIADPNGIPVLDKRLFLLDADLSEEHISDRYPTLHQYLQEGREQGLPERYLCRHRKRWYAQEKRAAAPIVCTYLGRSDNKAKRPFRFILNHSKATVANVWLAMYPTPVMQQAIQVKPDILRQIWQTLNRIDPEQLLSEGRVYGGGLHKLEPKELGNVPVPELMQMLSLKSTIRQVELET